MAAANPIIDYLVSKVGSRKVVIFAVFYYLFTQTLIDAIYLTWIGVATLAALAIEDAAKAIGAALVKSAEIKTKTVVRFGGGDETDA